MENNKDCVWKPVGQGLMTKWAKDVTPDNVLPDYPRPQMTRDHWMNLNGLWDYAIRPKGMNGVSEYDGKILVPFSVESALSGVRKPLSPDERLWYNTSFSIPEDWKGQRLLLHFGAVDWKAEVWINGQKVGEHTGGYYPFTFDITECLANGENEVTVAVWDPTDAFGQERGKQLLKPSGLFYTPVSGIWQTVWLEPVSQHYIKSHRLTPDIDSESLAISLDVEGLGQDMTFEAIAYEKGQIIASGQCAAGEALKLPIPSPKLWSPDSPFLYDLKVTLRDGQKALDEIKSYFGMRKFSIEKDKKGLKRLCLNHQPLFLNGVLDQGYWPEGLYTAPTDEALASDIETLKKLGYNMVRKHIKVEPARWYYHCDRLGLIVWQDMINGGAGWSIFYQVIIPYLAGLMKIKDNKYKALGRKEKANRDNYRKELKEMMDALYNVTSIGMWVPFNEAWGQFDAAEIAQWVHSYDPTRWVDHASGWYDQEIGEIHSIHTYFRRLTMPKRTKGRTVVISEYGGYSLPQEGHMWLEDKGFGYKRFKSADELEAAYTALIREQVKPLIEKGVSAVVYTQLTDVETEINGLMTYDRGVIKMNSDNQYKLNRELSDYEL